MDRKEYVKKYNLDHKEEKAKWLKKWRQTKKGKISKKKSDERRHIEAKKIMHRLKSNGCAICGYNKCDRALDFHHVNSEDKKFPLNVTGMKRKNKYIIEELNKCILLCKNCHYEIHDKN